jgi:hypothetical protein
VRDENNRLKGEQRKPDIKGSKKASIKIDFSEKDVGTIHELSLRMGFRLCIFNFRRYLIDRKEIVEYPQELLPADAQFKAIPDLLLLESIYNLLTG